jgi:hypothetical protein
LLIVLFALAACATVIPEDAGTTPGALPPAPLTATVRPTSRSGPTATAVLQATGTPVSAEAPTATMMARPAYTPDLAWLGAQTYEGWQSYESDDYGFRLRYPQGWTLTEVTGATDTMVGHRIDLVDDADPRNGMHLAYRRADEAVQIVPTGMSQGEIEERGSITFLGEILNRRSLVDRKADSKILYGTGEVARGELVFWMDLYRVAEGGVADDVVADDGAERGLPEDVQRVADEILSSLTLSAR